MGIFVNGCLCPMCGGRSMTMEPNGGGNDPGPTGGPNSLCSGGFDNLLGLELVACSGALGTACVGGCRW